MNDMFVKNLLAKHYENPQQLPHKSTKKLAKYSPKRTKIDLEVKNSPKRKSPVAPARAPAPARARGRKRSPCRELLRDSCRYRSPPRRNYKSKGTLDCMYNKHYLKCEEGLDNTK